MDFSLVQKEEPLPAGAGVRKTAFIRFPEGHIEYKGGTPDPERPGVKGIRFGLNFWRTGRQQGGWDSWNFLRVTVRFDNRRQEEIISTRLLHDVEILEDSPRRMVRFRWPLEENGEGFLTVTFLQYPNQSGWLLMKVDTSDSAAAIERIALSAYPGQTAGPKERERWAAADSFTFPLQLQSKAKPLTPVPSGLVFFNRQAQQNAGVQLVPDPEALEGMTVSGSYSVNAMLDLAPGTTVFSLALGGYSGEETDEVIRMFAQEGSRNTLEFLRQADWTPFFSPKTFEQLAEILETLLADVGTPEEQAAFSGFSAAYEEAVKQRHSEQIRQALADMRELRALLLARALARLH